MFVSKVDHVYRIRHCQVSSGLMIYRGISCHTTRPTRDNTLSILLKEQRRVTIEIIRHYHTSLKIV